MSIRAKPPSRTRRPAPAAVAATDAEAEPRPGNGAPAPLDTTGLTHLVGYAASRAAIEMRKVFARHMQPLDLKVVDYSILVLVARNPQVNQKHIGQALDISAPNLAITLDRLVARGWVQRVRSEQDRRAQHIRLTAEGRELVDRATRIAATMEDPALGMLSAAERALLIELLLKVAGGAGAAR